MRVQAYVIPDELNVAHSPSSFLFPFLFSFFLCPHSLHSLSSKRDIFNLFGFRGLGGILYLYLTRQHFFLDESADLRLFVQVLVLGTMVSHNLGGFHMRRRAVCAAA